MIGTSYELWKEFHANVERDYKKKRYQNRNYIYDTYPIVFLVSLLAWDNYDAYINESTPFESQIKH